jgi:hypothetical protein
MIDAIRVALTAARTGGVPNHGDLIVVELPGVSRVLLGMDDLRRPHLLLELSSDIDSPTGSSDIATLEIGERPLVLAGQTLRFIDVACLFQSVADVFEHFVSAVAERIQFGQLEPANALSEVLEKWKQFLVPASAPVGREKLAATMGELLVLLDIVRTDPARRVDSWLGPFGGRHDFRRGSSALEVKTTRAHTSRDVTIHGEDQLDAPANGSLHLHFVRLEHVPSGGESLVSVVDDLLSAGVAADSLFEALAASGIPVSELAATADVPFEVRERLTILVDEATPRIVPASFLGGTIPTGVVDLSYKINLDSSLAGALNPTRYLNVVASLGRDV